MQKADAQEDGQQETTIIRCRMSAELGSGTSALRHFKHFCSDDRDTLNTFHEINLSNTNNIIISFLCK